VLHYLSLPTGSRIAFADGFILQDLPEWIRQSKMLDNLSFTDRHGVLQASQALLAEYAASSIGEPDPLWKGKGPRTIQQSKSQSAILANLALWLASPSNVCFTVSFHAISWNLPDLGVAEPVVQQTGVETPLHCHPKDEDRIVSVDQAVRAGQLHAALVEIPRKNSVWTAMRAIWAGLTMYARDIRYLLFWVGLEALFGSDDGREISYKLAQRIAFFISGSPAEAKKTFREVKACYATRSQIAHGRWEDTPTFDDRMEDTERFARTVFLKLLGDEKLMNVFLARQQRDKYLEEFVFSNTGSPPASSTSQP
jgi:hypothetical protein